MAKYTEMDRAALQAEFAAVQAEYEALKARGLSLDMSRGKPGSDQMDLSWQMFDSISHMSGYKNETGVDCRNYGGLDGLPELKNLFSQILEVAPEQIIVGGNSSLNMMYDTVAQAMTHGFGGAQPWLLQQGVKFICPAPGYDRHFMICEHFGIEMIPVALNDDGPDMDAVRELVKDEKVKGMWCVPKYANPNGITYSDDVVRQLAALRPAAKDFRIFWDNAYVIHHLEEPGDSLLNIYEECKKQGNEDLVIEFTSTSKITFPGAGVAAEAASPRNVAELKSRMGFQTIGPDKLNQLRHARCFKNMEDLTAHMRHHAAVLRPKFAVVLQGLESLADTGIAQWKKPKGGYFISLFTLPGTAKRAVALCREAGLVLTGAGATYPYGKDPADSNIRIAPSYPGVEELRSATALLCVSLKYAALEHLLAK